MSTSLERPSSDGAAPQLVRLEGCFEDSPFFRADLAMLEQSTADFEATSKNLLKLARACVDNSKAHMQKSTQFADELLRFAQRERSQEDHAIDAGLQRFGEALHEIEAMRAILHQQAEMVLIEPLEHMIKNDLGSVATAQRAFNKSSDDYDRELNRYLARKPKEGVSAEAAQEVAQARREFHGQSLNYVLKLNDVQAKKKFEFFEKVLAYLYAQASFHHQAYEMLHDMFPYMSSLSGQLQKARTDHKAEQAQKEELRLSLIKACEPYYVPTSLPPPSVTPVREDMADASSGTVTVAKQGYLLKKASQLMKMTEWQRRYFVIRGGLLIYYTRGKDNEEPTVATNLRLCTVKPVAEVDRRFCFQVISPIKSYTLQASSDEDLNSWVLAISQAISNALSSKETDVGDFGLSKEKKEKLPKGMVVPPQRRLQEQVQALPPVSPSTGAVGSRATATPGSTSSTSLASAGGAVTAGFPPLLLQELRALPGNDRCADCGAPQPEWASITTGALLCIECSGVHRSMGTHVSKVRSLTLDIWDTTLQQIFLATGNAAVNAILERNRDLPGLPPAPTATSPTNVKAAWIKAKHMELAMAQPLVDASQLLHDACAAGDLISMLTAKAGRADLNAPDVRDELLRSPLIRTVDDGRNECFDWLLLWGADINAADAQGRTALMHAAIAGRMRCASLLLKRHARTDAQDAYGNTVLAYALERENAELASIIRLSELEQASGGEWLDGPIDALVSPPSATSLTAAAQAEPVNPFM